MSKGFTLVELMVVITVIAILATLGVGTYNGVQTKAKEAKMKADIDDIAKVYESKYDASTNTYFSLESTDFKDGRIPTTLEGEEYSFEAGPDSTAGQTDTFKVCTPTGTYCRGALQGATPP